MNYWIRERMNEECDFIGGYTIGYELVNPLNNKETKFIKRDFEDENSALKFIIKLLNISNQISQHILAELLTMQNCTYDTEKSELQHQPQCLQQSIKKKAPF